jgi:hypothetical protein
MNSGSCSLGLEVIGRTRFVRSATDYNLPVVLCFFSAIKFHRE